MYKKVIDLLIGMGNVEKEKLAVELAKHHPSIFIKLVEGKGKEEEVMLDNDIVFIINALNAGRRIEGIRGVMSYFQYGLKEAYDVERAFRGEDVFLSSLQKLAVEKLTNTNKVLKFADLAN